LVNFAGVTNPATTTMYIGVRSRNGVGYSVKSNTTNVDVVNNLTGIPGLFNTTYTATQTLITPPNIQGSTTYAPSGFAPKTSTLKKFIGTIPKAPSKLVLTNPASATPTTAITNAARFMGTTTPLTLTAAASALASSYSWELPLGVTQLSGGNSSIITVDLFGVAPGTTTLYFGVKAVNGIGSSVKDNAAAVPATSSTATLLKVTNTAPAAVSSVTGTLTAISCGTTYSYTMTASPLATSYIITGPTGSVVTSASNPSNPTNTITTSDLTFSVVYPINLSTVTPKTIVITSVNGFGNSTTNRTLTVVPATLAAVGVIGGGSTFSRTIQKTISIPAITNATTYTWSVVNGAVIVSGQGTNSVLVDFSLVPLASSTNVVSVFASSNCGVNTPTKSITLTATLPRMAESTIIDENVYSNASVYPNPATSELNIDIDASISGDVQMSIYSITGIMVMNSNTIKLEEGRNTISENISNLSNGLYIVRLVDSSNKEVMVKKLMKN
jgi:hypothetical protein